MQSFTHLVKGLDPVADAFAGTKYTDIISLKNHDYAEFVIYKGVGATGTSTITVEACDDISASNSSAIVFHYQVITTGDTHGALTAATVSGFTTTAGSSQLYKIVVQASDLASLGYEYVRLKMVEVVDDPVLGGVLATLHQPRYDQSIQESAID